MIIAPSARLRQRTHLVRADPRWQEAMRRRGVEDFSLCMIDPWSCPSVTYTAADRPLVDTDLVVWFTFGTNHAARPEDWPVMPVMPVGFRLAPAGFFTGNPALDNPPPDRCHRGG